MTEKQSPEFVQLVLLAFLFIYNALSLRNAVVVLATNTPGRGSMAKLKRLARILSGTLCPAGLSHHKIIMMTDTL